MRLRIQLLLFLLIPVFLKAQERLPDSMALALQKATNDSMRYAACEGAVYYFVELNRDSLLHYINKCIILAQRNGQKLEEGWGLASRGYCQTGMGEYSQAFASLLKAFELEEDSKNEAQDWLPPGQTGRHRRLYFLSYTHHLFAILMREVRNYEQAIFHYMEAKRIALEIKVPRGVLWADMNLGFSYMAINKPDSARFFAEQAKELSLKTPGEKKYLAEIISTLAFISLKEGDAAKAKQLYREAITEAVEHKNYIALTRIYGSLASIYFNEHKKDSSRWYAGKAFESVRTIGRSTAYVIDISSVYKNLYRSYLLNNQPDSALKYAGLAMAAKDSTAENEIKNVADFQKMSLAEQFRLQNLEKERVVYQNRMRTYAMVAGLGVFLLIATLLYRNNRKKQRTNKALEQALTDLKSTQTQLIQSEKMASLGELTAGIAHEIQNPLNFVNNFSEVNKELIEELKSEKSKVKSERDEELEGQILNDIEQNLEKINHHGKRADAIVKGMLQHSRTSSGQKEPTDINVLADEYLRLAYHGLRAKDKSFNAITKTDFDSRIGKMNIIPQDIGRVILNLINNAFYAVDEKKKLNVENYEPTVSVSTKKVNGKSDSYRIEIKVSDNGDGIPQKILDKIFQPFFTTKPTGQGTGLGLSLSYDIIKAHGGEIKVNTKENEGTEFTIALPA